MTKVKICGVTLADDAARVAAAGADFLGLNFWPKSKRYLAPARAPLIVAAAREAGPIAIVGLFVNASLAAIIAATRDVQLDIVQLHGDESPDDVRAIADATQLPVWKAVAVGAAADVAHLQAWPADAILLDTPSAGRGGSGHTFDWSLARTARVAHPARRIVLAGGLTADNVAAAVREVTPWAIDVASGVESAPGIKDPAKLAALLAAVRAT